MPDVVTQLFAGLVALLAAALAAGGLFWLACRLVNAVAGRAAVPVPGYPHAVGAAAVAVLAQLLAVAAVAAPATAFVRVDWTALGPGLVLAAGLAATAAVLAAVAASGLLLPARPGRAAAVGLVFCGLVWAAVGGGVYVRGLV